MATEFTPSPERRRSERVLLRVAVKIYGKTKDGHRVEEEAEAVIVSRHGALLRSTSGFQAGTRIELLNKYSQKQLPFRVVWCSEIPASGRCDVGLESVGPSADFWGIHFPGEKRS